MRGGDEARFQQDVDLLFDPFLVLDWDHIRLLLDGDFGSCINIVHEGGIAFDVVKGGGQNVFIILEEVVDSFLLVGFEVLAKFVGQFGFFSSAIFKCSDFFP